MACDGPKNPSPDLSVWQDELSDLAKVAIIAVIGYNFQWYKYLKK